MESQHRGSGDEERSPFQKYLENISQTSPTHQLALGALTGFLAGIRIFKTGKTVAMVLGSAIILLNFACVHGYIQVNWKKFHMESDNADNDDTGVFQQVQQQVVNHIIINKRTWLEKAVAFCQENTSLTSGIVGGFLIGIATSL